MPTKHSRRAKAIQDPTLRRTMSPELEKLPGKRLVVRPAKQCDCRVGSAVHFWRSETLGPSFNAGIDFAVWLTAYGVSAQKRLVIEFVTAQVTVPAGEMARLRMYTGLGSEPSNHDLVLVQQGVAGGQQVLLATHSVRGLLR